jgi:hypothetical protein
MKDKITVRCELSGQCDVEIWPDEVEGMTDSEIREWVHDGAHIEFWEQGKCNIRLCDIDYALEEYRRDFPVEPKGDDDDEK